MNPMISMCAYGGTKKTISKKAVDIIDQIRGPLWQKPVEHIRAIYTKVLADTGNTDMAKRAVKDLKVQLAAALWSGQYNTRDKDVFLTDKLIAYSGLLCADLDDLGPRLAEVRALLLSSPFLWALFTSPTGTGLKAVLRVQDDVAQHHCSFLAVQAHVRELCKVEVDEKCKDEARLCFVSYDPDAYLNREAAVLPPLPELAKGTNTPNASKLLILSASASAVPLGAAALKERKKIAEGLFTIIKWTDDTNAFITCPGTDKHTNTTDERACELHLDGVPNIYCFHNSCRATVEQKNNELRARIQAEWPAPGALPNAMPDVLPFNYSCLPSTLRPWLEDISERMQCPPDFPAVSATIALGSLIGRKIGIRPKRQDDWLVVPNLWGMTVGRPGIMKTPANEQALAPLKRLIADAMEKHKTESEGYEASLVIEAQRSKLLEKDVLGLLKDGKEQEARNLTASVLKAKHDAPVLRRYMVNDSTVEKLAELLNQNPNGLLQYRDELIGTLRSLDKEGREDSRAFYLEAWNGAGVFVSDRIGRGTTQVPSVTLSVFGAIQPGPLSEYLRQGVKSGAGDDGLLQRFQLGVWPDASKQWRNVDRRPDDAAKDKAFSVFKYLDELTAESVRAEIVDGIPFLRFSPDAQDRFDAWRAGLEASLRGDTEHDAFEAHLSKYRKLVPALALINHLANRDIGPVTLAALEKSLIWAKYLESHARRIYSSVLRPDLAAARELAKHLGRGDLGNGFTLREIYRKGWIGISSKEDAEAATEILTDIGWIRLVQSAGSGSGRPAGPAFEVNPRICKYLPGGADKTDTTPQEGLLSVLAAAPAAHIEIFSVAGNAGNGAVEHEEEVLSVD